MVTKNHTVDESNAKKKLNTPALNERPKGGRKPPKVVTRVYPAAIFGYIMAARIIVTSEASRAVTSRSRPERSEARYTSPVAAIGNRATAAGSHELSGLAPKNRTPPQRALPG